MFAACRSCLKWQVRGFSDPVRGDLGVGWGWEEDDFEFEVGLFVEVKERLPIGKGLNGLT
jgi:hypothetical protein